MWMAGEQMAWVAKVQGGVDFWGDGRHVWWLSGGVLKARG